MKESLITCTSGFNTTEKQRETTCAEGRLDLLVRFISARIAAVRDDARQRPDVTRPRYLWRRAVKRRDEMQFEYARGDCVELRADAKGV